MADTLAEHSVLGSILIDARCLEDMPGLTTEDFEIETDKHIFNAIQNLISANASIDPVTVIHQMEQDGTYTPETKNYVLQLMEITPSAANAAQYASIVRTNAIKRKMSALSDSGIGKRELNKRLKELQEQLEAIEAGSKWAKVKAVSASDIDMAHIPQPTFFIDGMMTQGVYFLNGFSKIGKSRLLLQMLLAISTGGMFLDRKTMQCDVLYMALEDAHMDYQNRLNKMLNGQPVPATLRTITEEECPDLIVPTLDPDGGLVDIIKRHLREYPNTRVIGLESFKDIQSRRTRNPVDDDKRDINLLKKLSAEYDIAIIVAHHVSVSGLRSNSKRTSSIGSGSGTFALSGTVHGEFELMEDSEADGLMVFRIGGRRIKKASFSLKDNYPCFDFLGDYKSMKATTRDDENARALIETIRYIFNDRVQRSKFKKWDGNASQIYAINLENTDLAPMDKKPRRESFTSAVHSELRKNGILVRTISNGSGGSVYRIEPINSIYEQGSILP